MPRSSLLAVLPLLLLLLGFAPASHADWYKEERAIMGTSILAEIWSTDADKADAGIEAVMQEMHRIDERMSLQGRQRVIADQS